MCASDEVPKKKKKTGIYQRKLAQTRTRARSEEGSGSLPHSSSPAPCTCIMAEEWELWHRASFPCLAHSTSVIQAQSSLQVQIFEVPIRGTRAALLSIDFP